MPRRSILSAAERESLFALPETNEELIWHYTFSESDLSIGHTGRRNQSGSDQDGLGVSRHNLRQAVVVASLAHPR